MTSKLLVARPVRAIAAPLLAVLAACAQEPPKPVTIENMREVTATVEAIDVATRMVSLRGPDGEVVTVQVDPAVRNLPRVKVGDRVVARYYEALGAELKKRGGTAGETSAAASEPEVAVAVGRAEEGARPAGVLSFITSPDLSNLDTCYRYS